MKAEFDRFWHDGVHSVYFNRTTIVFADFLQHSETFFFFYMELLMLNVLEVIKFFFFRATANFTNNGSIWQKYGNC